MNRLGIAGLPLLLALTPVGCDLGSKSVTGTADDDAGGDGTGSDSSTDDGRDDGVTSANSGDGPPIVPLCLETQSVLSGPAEVSPIGVSANDAYARFDGWTTAMQWLPNDGPTQVVPAGTTTNLDIGLAPLDGEIRFIDSEPNPDSMIDIAPNCQDRLEFDVEVHFATADGRFDELYTAVGMVSENLFVELNTYFEPNEFSGTFSAAEISFDGNMGEVRRFNIAMGLAMEGTDPPTGSVNMEVELQFGENPDEAAVGFGSIATFPAVPQ